MIDNIVAYLESSANRMPNKAAFVDENGETTFFELLETVKRVGGAVADKILDCRPVAVLMDARDRRCVAALLGVLYAGGCYSPLDIDMPLERLNLILNQLQPALILYDAKASDLAEQVEFPVLRYGDAIQHDPMPSHVPMRPDDLMSILFTSGSTGLPKGVTQSHASYLTYTEATIHKFNFNENTVFGNQSPFFYANSIIDIYPPIATGATVFLLPARTLSFPKYLIDKLNEWRITELTMTPSSYVKVAGSDALTENSLPFLEYIILSGEAASWATLEKWMAAAPGASVWNFYGSTEAYSVAVWRVDRTFSEGDIIPVGATYEEVEMMFLNDANEPVTLGEKGEMYVHSPWLSSGYYRDSPRTDAVFLTINGKRWYRTGDIGFINCRGELTVLGRKDNQIKHLGYRMELGEVEYALQALSGWESGCCLFDQDSGKIYCFYTGSLAQKAITAGLREKLPRYALPDAYIHLETLPYTATMKLNREALKAYFRA